METSDSSTVFSTVLSAEEWSQIPSDLGEKLLTFVKSKFDEYITSKALYETKKVEIEEKFANVKNELNTYKSKNEDCDRQLEIAKKAITELENQLTLSTNEVTKFQETSNRLESSTAEFRHQRDMAIDERDSLTQMLERRNAEIERLQTDLKALSAQLNTAVNAKCEALAKIEEVSSLKLSLEYKERHMEQEKSFLHNQIKNLTSELNKRAGELQNSRHEHTTNSILLETKLSSKSEELRIATETIATLTSNNKTLTCQVEELNEKLKKQHDSEIKLQESFNNELLAQTRLAELYKSQNEENNSQVEELQKGIVELQNLVRSASDQYGKLETKHRDSEIEHEEILNKKNECIVMLKKEIDTANELLKQAKEDNLHREIENLSPSAATASRLIKGNTSLTQIYLQLVTTLENLAAEKDENRRLNSYINKIVQEFEDKTPILQKEREDYEHALETISELTKHNENMILECHRLREECSEAKKRESRACRDNERMKKEITDLARQVCFLLKEVEASRTASTPSPDHDLSDSVSSAEIISKKLVTFSDIQELQQNNQKLLALVRELSTKQEESECMDATSIAGLRDRLRNARENQSQMLEAQEQQNKMLESVIRQRDTYRSLVQKTMKLPADEEMLVDQTSNTESEIQTIKDSEKKLKELEDKLEDTKKELGQLKDEYETYKKEKCAHEKILVDQVEQLRKDHREMTQINCKLTSMSEYNEERFKILKQNSEIYKNQIAALEEKNKTYNSIIIKHEQSIMHLKDETLSAQTKCSRAEVALHNMQQECRLLRDVESRLLKEKKLQARESHGQNLLLTNLELIEASLERSEAEGKIRLESRLDETLRECSALRRRLQEEQDKFRELSTHLEKQTGNVQTRMNEEKQQSDHLRTELSAAREELINKTQQIDELSKKIKNSLLMSHTSTEEQRTRELERQLNESQAEIESLKQQLILAKENLAQYCNNATSAEHELKKEHERNLKIKEETEATMKQQNELITNLRDKLDELEAELSLQSSGQAETTIELKNQLVKLRDNLQILNEELSVSNNDLQAAKNEIKYLSETVQVSEDKYAREMMLHSSDLQALSTLKEDRIRITSELNQVKNEKDQAVEALNITKSSSEEFQKLLENEKEELSKRFNDLEAQNNVLYDQIQALSTQLSVLQAQHSDLSLGESSFNRSLTEDDVKSSEQLLQVIKYLRKEKDLAITKFEVLQAENLRLKSQFEMIERNLTETRSALNKEREGSDVSMVTAAKHAEVLRKVETLNAITDSNKILRDERDGLKMELRELSARASSIEDQLAPLQEKNRELSMKAESASAENQALRAEAARWRQRANVLIEKANKISPEDWRRLQNEREGLAKMLSAEKESYKRQTEEANNLRLEKSRLEDQVSQLSQQSRKLAHDMKKQSDELSSTKQQVVRMSQELIEAREIAAQRTDENTKITEDLAAKDVMLTDIRAKETQVRKIAKKYKTQFEELQKAMDEEKRKNAEKPQQVEIPAKLQDTYRQEGRHEAEQRITELEKTHSDRLVELTSQITSSQEENDTLRKENTALKNAEMDKDERLKLLRKTAKTKIIELTDERNKFKRDLTELRIRFDSVDQSKDVVARLEKEKSDALAEKQQEKERLMRDIDVLNQRINQLQRQLGFPAASKPSTSSGSLEKSGLEPPSANIKPMSGHSNPQQQSATVMPWRDNQTPFASIRPMSQLRTAAILPTSQTSAANSNTSPNTATAVLVPPQQQQQLVHTTGNSSLDVVMSSSPISSHTDYMPATSSAATTSSVVQGVRQVVVPPTQQATIGMSSREEPPSAAESTQQDMDQEPMDQPQQPIHHQQQSQQPQSQPQQAAVAMVMPRIEQQQSTSTSSSQTPNVELSSSTSGATAAVAAPSTSSAVAVASVAAGTGGTSQQASSSNTVTTTQAGGHKRPRETTEGDRSTGGQGDDASGKIQQQAKRTRTQVPEAVVFQGVTESGVEVEYQVPTSSQLDQEDADVVIVLSEDDGDGPDEGEADAGEGEEEEEEEEEGIMMMMMEADDDAPFEESGDGEGDAYEMERFQRTISNMAAGKINLMSILEDLLDDSSSSSDSEDEIVATMLRLNKEKRPKIENYIENVTEKQEQELTYDDADCHDEMDESEPVGGVQDDPNNEVEIIDDSSEVSNQSGGSSSSISAAPEQSGVGGSNGEEGGGGGRSAERDDGGVNSGVQQAPASLASQSEVISSGSEGQSATPSVPIFPRNRNQVTPLSSSSSSSRQQQSTSHLLVHPGGYDEAGGGDDGIVPSTPILYVPRRTDGFGEAVSSPHVPSGRFTFGETSSGASAGRGGGIGVASQGDGIDDTRVDLSQLDESGMGRSVPSTPLQVSPQGEQRTEGSSEVGPSVEEQSELTTEPTQGEDIPLITVTLANKDEAETSSQQDRNNEPAAGGGDDVGDSGRAFSAGPASAGPSGTTAEGRRSTPTLTPGAPDGQDDVVVGGDELLESEEGMDGVSSEGEKPQAMEDTEIEEGREAEATESPSSNTRSRSHGRGLATARRSNRIPFRHRHPRRLTPIVWNETLQQHHHQQQQQRSGSGSSGSGVGRQQQHHGMNVGGVARGRGTLSDSPVRWNFATRHRARRVRQLRGPFGRF